MLNYSTYFNEQITEVNDKAVKNVGAEDFTASSTSSGVSDHAALLNLDLASSKHIYQTVGQKTRDLSELIDNIVYFSDYLDANEVEAVKNGTSTYNAYNEYRQCLLDASNKVGYTKVELPANGLINIGGYTDDSSTDELHNVVIEGNNCTIKAIPTFSYPSDTVNNKIEMLVFKSSSNIRYKNIVYDNNGREFSTRYKWDDPLISVMEMYFSAYNIVWDNCIFKDNWEFSVMMVGCDQCFFYNCKVIDADRHARLRGITAQTYNGTNSVVDDLIVDTTDGEEFWWDIDYQITIDQGGTTFSVARTGGGSTMDTSMPLGTIASGIVIADYISTWFEFDETNLGTDEGKIAYIYDTLIHKTSIVGTFSPHPRIKFTKSSFETSDSWTFKWVETRNKHPFLFYQDNVTNIPNGVNGVINCQYKDPGRGGVQAGGGGTFYYIGNRHINQQNALYLQNLDTCIATDNVFYGNTEGGIEPLAKEVIVQRNTFIGCNICPIRQTGSDTFKTDLYVLTDNIFIDCIQNLRYNTNYPFTRQTAVAECRVYDNAQVLITNNSVKGNNSLAESLVDFNFLGSDVSTISPAIANNVLQDGVALVKNGTNTGDFLHTTPSQNNEYIDILLVLDSVILSKFEYELGMSDYYKTYTGTACHNNSQFILPINSTTVTLSGCSITSEDGTYIIDNNNDTVYDINSAYIPIIGDISSESCVTAYIQTDLDLRLYNKFNLDLNNAGDVVTKLTLIAGSVKTKAYINVQADVTHGDFIGFTNTNVVYIGNKFKLNYYNFIMHIMYDPDKDTFFIRMEELSQDNHAFYGQRISQSYSNREIESKAYSGHYITASKSDNLPVTANYDTAIVGTNTHLVIEGDGSFSSGAGVVGVNVVADCYNDSLTIPNITGVRSSIKCSAGIYNISRLMYCAGGKVDGHVDTYIGLDVADLTFGTYNYAIRTGTGIVSIGDRTFIAGSLKTGGNDDEVQMITSGNYSQTVNLHEWRKSDGTVLASVSNDGAMSAVSFIGNGSKLTNIETGIPTKEVADGVIGPSKILNGSLCNVHTTNINVDKTDANNIVFVRPTNTSMCIVPKSDELLYAPNGYLTTLFNMEEGTTYAIVSVELKNKFFIFPISRHALKDHYSLELPIFTAYNNTSQTRTGDEWVLDTILNWTQDFIDTAYYSFDAANGIFTILKSGRYKFTGQASIRSTSTSTHSVGIQFKQGSTVFNTSAYAAWGASDGSDRKSLTTMEVRTCAANDTFTLGMFSSLAATDRLDNNAYWEVVPI